MDSGDAANAADYPQTHIIGDLAAGDAFDVDDALKFTGRILARKQKGGRYILEREIARGGMGVIYSVYDQDLRRHSVLKVISSNMLHEQRKVMAFVKEARITAYLEHPNIIPVHEIGMNASTGQPFYTMKKVEGEPLSYIIHRLAKRDRSYEMRFPRHRLLDIFRKVCDAVAYAHSKGIIHRDIKPENIMVGNYGEVVLMDWGLAKFISDRDRSDETTSNERLFNMPGRDPDFSYTMTEDGIIKGSLAYLSPEQAFGDQDRVDFRSDIFLLGATLYHMLTFYPPYYGNDVNEVLERAEKCDYLPPNARNPEAQLPIALERIILKAMAPLPVNRYQSVTELLDDLDAFLSGRRVCGRQIFQPGEKLIEYGDTSRDTYVIIDGSVQVNRIINGVEHPIAVLGRGAIVGEMAGITHQNRSATVIALERTHVLVITMELMMEELEKLPPWMENIIFSLAERVRILDANVHPLMLKSRAFPVLNQLYLIFAGNANDPYHEFCDWRPQAVYDEIEANLGIDRESIVKVVDVMLQSGMIRQKDQSLYVPDIEEFALFVDYCRLHFGIKGGIKSVRQIELPQEQESFFRQVLRQLRALHIEQEKAASSQRRH